MRIVGGQWRGKPLKAPEGRATRPTTDRTRESAASMLEASFGLDLSGLSVLDAYAGSGAMSFELLSRGVSHATLVDASKVALATVRANVSALKLGPAQASIILGDVELLAEKAATGGRALTGAPFDIVFLDPPYATANEALEQLIAHLSQAGALATTARILIERDAKTPPLDLERAGIPNAMARKPKKHGVTSLELIALA